jgi:PKD repeat protein
VAPYKKKFLGETFKMLKFLTSWIYVAPMVAVSVSAYAGQATLAWDSPNELGISSHRLYYGEFSRNDTLSIDLGNELSYTVTGLQGGKTYYFAATTIGVSEESGYSNELSKVIPEMPPVANFSANPRTGKASLRVSFSDSSMGVSQSDSGTSVIALRVQPLASFFHMHFPGLTGVYTVSWPN